MAKKTHVKVRLVPESKPDSPFFYYVKNLLVEKKLKLNFQLKNTIQLLENMKILSRKNFHLTANNYVLLKLRLS
jgi:hypothetical protein